MKRLKNILIIFICFLMLCSFTNDKTTSLDYIPLNELNNKSGANEWTTLSSYDSRNVIDTFNNQSSKNQSSLSICWAFSSNSVIEAYMKKIKNLTYNLSENQPEYVSRYLGDTTNFGSANSTFNTVKYLFYNAAPMDETTFEPSGYFTSLKQKSLNQYLNISNSPFDIRETRIFNALNIKSLLADYTPDQIQNYMNQYNSNIKEYIYKYGAVMSVIHTDSAFFVSNKNGGYGWCYNNGSKEESEYKGTAHAVTIIGWDDNYVWNGNNPAPYKGAWLAANSWGTNTTFFYISYYDLSVVKSLIGISSIELNNNKAKYNNSYLVGESSSYKNSYGDNRERYYNRTNTATTSETFTYYIGDDSEKLYTAKLFYLGFNNSTTPTKDLKVKIEFPDLNVYTTKTIMPGINTYTFSTANLSGNVKVKVSIVSPTNLNIANMLYAVELFTKSSNNNSKIVVKPRTEFTNTVNVSTIYDIATKNMDSYEKANYSINVYDANGKDVTSNFTVTKKDMAFESASVTLQQKTKLSTGLITVKATAGGTIGRDLDIDGTNKIVKKIPYNTTVNTLINRVSAGSVSVINSSNTALSGSSLVKNGHKLKVVTDTGTYTYDISVMGDVNGDGEIDISDAMKIVAYIVRGSSLGSKVYSYSADVTNDNEIDISDASKIVAHIVRGVEL